MHMVSLAPLRILTSMRAGSGGLPCNVSCTTQRQRIWLALPPSCLSTAISSHSFMAHWSCRHRFGGGQRLRAAPLTHRLLLRALPSAAARFTCSLDVTAPGARLFARSPGHNTLHGARILSELADCRTFPADSHLLMRMGCLPFSCNACLQSAPAQKMRTSDRVSYPQVAGRQLLPASAMFEAAFSICIPWNESRSTGNPARC